MDNQPVQTTETQGGGEWLALLLGLIVILGLMVFVFFAGTWYAGSHNQGLITPVVQYGK